MTDSERFDDAIEKLLAGRSPRADAELMSDEEQEMLLMAQRLRGAVSEPIDPEFRVRLRDRLFGGSVRVSRRTAFLSGVGTLAAGIFAGLGIDRAVRSTPSNDSQPLVSENGKWFTVANVQDVPEGAVHPFTAGAVHGYLINHQGEIRALSRVCTHMGCTLRFKQSEQTFECPCHGAEFAMDGHVRLGAGGYSLELPPLPRINVRVKGSSIDVWSV